MTDNEIIKALECCISNRDCSACVFLGSGIGSQTTCEVKMIKSALDLINRQQAEIEELNHSLDTLGRVKEQLKERLRGQESKASEEIHSLCAEIRTLKKTNKAYEEECNRLICLIPKTRAEAIKEFAERLKKDLNNMARFKVEFCDYFLVGLDFVDNLVKEMVGENP